MSVFHVIIGSSLISLFLFFVIWKYEIKDHVEDRVRLNSYIREWGETHGCC